MKFKRTIRVGLIAAAYVAIAACSTAPPVRNASGMRTLDIPVGSTGPVHGVGIEGRDIVSMTDRMARDMLSAGFSTGLTAPPRVIVDDRAFSNEGSQRINKKLIVNRLRVELNRSAQGRMVFVGRENVALVEEERQLKREGVVDVGTTGSTKATAGADFRLTGTIATSDSRNPSSGVIQRYNQITFELIDLESAVLVWSNIYEFERASADDVIYR